MQPETASVQEDLPAVTWDKRWVRSLLHSFAVLCHGTNEVMTYDDDDVGFYGGGDDEDDDDDDDNNDGDDDDDGW